MSGRGRGRAVNMPAWMTRGGGGPSPPDNNNNRGGGDVQQQQPPRDDFGRSEPPFARGPPGGGGGYSDRDRYNNNNNSSGGSVPPMQGGAEDDFYRGPPRGGGPPPSGFHGGGGGGGRQHHRGGPPPRGGGGGPQDYDHRQQQQQHHRGPPPPPQQGGGGGGGGGGPPRRRTNTSGITFRSYQEERAWVEERRRKRLARPSKFDVPPTPEQAAVDAQMLAMANPAATDFAGINPIDRNFAAVPQQTRHARRLYIGQLPPNVTEEELHVFFRDAIDQALRETPFKLEDDPILSVYINHERRFCFLEFKTVEMTTACLALDGIDLQGKGKVKVKRPNDYNPSMAPQVHPGAIPPLDVSKLGIISGTVPDGPNKIFIGGLHYHLTEDQILELLQAFGQVKSFHLVKNDPDSNTSKGYAFCEYADPSVTQIAVVGLNGMDLGGGKVLTARVAGERSTAYLISLVPGLTAGATTPTATTAISSLASPGAMIPSMPPLYGMDQPMQQQQQHQLHQAPSMSSLPSAGVSQTIIAGYDVDALLDAAMGLRHMPTAPTHLDDHGMPITRINAGHAVGVPPVFGGSSGLPPLAPIMPSYPSSTAALPISPPPLSSSSGPSALEIANAALDAAFGMASGGAPPQLPPAPALNGASHTTPSYPDGGSSSSTSRILVLHNMVTEQDLATDDDYQALMQEVREECSKYGTLLNMIIPRQTDSYAMSAVGKIFLEYGLVSDALQAQGELQGRQFGSSIVETSFLSEEDYAARRIK